MKHATIIIIVYFIGSVRFLLNTFYDFFFLLTIFFYNFIVTTGREGGGRILNVLEILEDTSLVELQNF